jgi:exodeoxyribonuclease VII large subunit
VKGFGVGDDSSAVDHSYTVSQINEEIREVLSHTFPLVWVVGEAQRVRPNRSGHLYFELVEKGQGDRIVGKLDAVVWRSHHQRLRRILHASGQEITEGQQLRCRGRVDFWAPGGRLQFVIDDIDPLFTLGHLERRRRETLKALAEAGLLDLNQAVPLHTVPLNIGLITSEGSAAYHDFLAGLTASAYGFRVFFVHAATQGREAEHEVTSALRMLTSLPLSKDLDCIALIRGGGSRSDLAVFDSRSIAEAIAHCSLPVLTGLGHEIDVAIADQVSHRPFKTPTMVAEFLCGRAAEADRKVALCEESLLRLAQDKVRRSEEQLRRSERLAQKARLRLQGASHVLRDLGRTLALLGQRRLQETIRFTDTIEHRLGQSAPRIVERQRPFPEQLLHRIVDIASGRLRQADTRLQGLSRLCHELAPERILERGFSLTHTPGGDILRNPDQVTPGDALITRVSGGTLKSRVEEL